MAEDEDVLPTSASEALSASLRALKKAGVHRNASQPLASAAKLSSAEVFSERMQLGIAAVGGFLFVPVCACLIKAISWLYGRRELEAVDGRTADSNVVDEQERATILAEVYGKPDDSMEELGDIGDEAALERAWKAIERAASSDEEFDEVELQPNASEDTHLSQEALHAIRGVVNEDPAFSPQNAVFDIGDCGDGAEDEDQGFLLDLGPANGHRALPIRAREEPASSSSGPAFGGSNILEL